MPPYHKCDHDFTLEPERLLEHTFIHIPGIGPKTEKRIWESGIYTWQDFLKADRVIINPSKDRMIRYELERSLRHRDEIRFFQNRLSSDQMWRLFQDFRDRAVYLDIETSGGFQGVDEITVIGLYDGDSVFTFVNGRNLEEFEIAIASYELVITFNGSTFDLPFIRRGFPHIHLPPAHIDLRFVLNRLGYKGGLKAIEKSMGISRESDIEGLNGFDAVLLWKAHQWGDREALKELIRYNTADIVNLEPLMEMAYEKMKAWLLKG